MRSMQWQLEILGTISAFAYRHRETKKNVCRDGRSQDLPNTDFQPAVRHLTSSSASNQQSGIWPAVRHLTCGVTPPIPICVHGPHRDDVEFTSMTKHVRCEVNPCPESVNVLCSVSRQNRKRRSGMGCILENVAIISKCFHLSLVLK